jgi:hypothetical protein
VLEAVKMGVWDYEIDETRVGDFPATDALPGTHEKVAVLAQRVALGLPLWHPRDRKAYDESAAD